MSVKSWAQGLAHCRDSVIHLFSRYLLGTFYELDTVLSTGGSVLNKTRQVSLHSWSLKWSGRCSS